MPSIDIKWLLALVAGIVLAGPAYGLEIVYPADQTVVSRSDYLIIKAGTSPTLDQLVVTINGVASDPIDISGAEYRAAFADMLILEPTWDLGRNALEVTGSAAGKVVATNRASFVFQPDSSARPPKGFKPFQMHIPERERLCVACHNMKPDRAQMSAPDPANNPCVGCHKKMLARKYVHGPSGVYECDACHDPASQPGKYRLISNGAKLCNECHIDKVEAFRKYQFIHGPVGVDLCIVCHEAHASDVAGLLLDKTNRLCLGCHDTVKLGEHVVRGVSGKGHPLEGKGNPMKPGSDFSCVSCHDPHGGNHRSLFILGVKGRFELCQQCHKK